MMGWTPPADGIEVPAWKSRDHHEGGRRPRCRLPPSVWISPRTCSSCTAPTRRAGRCSSASWRAARCWSSSPPCLVGLEACGAAHHWARELAKLGHEVRLMPPQYVRPYVKTNKHDAADAEACC